MNSLNPYILMTLTFMMTYPLIPGYSFHGSCILSRDFTLCYLIISRKNKKNGILKTRTMTAFKALVLWTIYWGSKRQYQYFSCLEVIFHFYFIERIFNGHENPEILIIRIFDNFSSDFAYQREILLYKAQAAPSYTFSMGSCSLRIKAFLGLWVVVNLHTTFHTQHFYPFSSVKARLPDNVLKNKVKGFHKKILENVRN